jgi:hypothetical protein
VAGTPRLGRWQRWGLAALVVVLDIALTAPLTGHGTLQLLDLGDYPQGPHPPFAPSAFGFPPGLTSRAPVEAVLYWIFQGIRWPPVHLLPFAVVAPLACTGFARAFPGRALAIGVATLLFTVNPFIGERMANGQVYVVMGYSLLPILLALAVRPLGSLTATWALGGLVFALGAALSVHYLYIGGLLLMIVVAAHLVFGQMRAVWAGTGIAACGAALSLYWLIPAVHASQTLRSPVTALDLSVFQTLPDRTWGLAVNISGLYGFWRPGVPLVKYHLSGWPFLLLAILVVVGFGLHELTARGGAPGRAFAASCATAGIAGGLLAAGAKGPAGELYTWLFAHFPGFEVMREPAKFSSLLALAYAACFGVGAEAVIRPLARSPVRVLCACCLAAVPLTYGYTQLWGFAGYASPSAYPASWAAADRAMSPGASALALPWRAYLLLPWAGNRVVANPMQSYFGRPVISGDDLEAGPIATETSNPRSRFLQFCLSEGTQISEFGRVLAPLGIRYVILARVPGAQSFGWLGRQHDLRRVFGTHEIVIYRNEEAVPPAYEPRRRLMLRDWGQVLMLAQRDPLIDYLIQVRKARPGPLSLPPALAALAASAPAPMPIKAVGGTAVSQPVDLSGAARAVVLPDPAYPGWRLNGFRTTSQFGVTTAFIRAAGTGHRARPVATYAPWRLVRICDVVGACLAAADVTVLAAALIGRRRRAARSATALTPANDGRK